MKQFIFTGLFLFLFLLAACGGGEETPPAAPPAGDAPPAVSPDPAGPAAPPPAAPDGGPIIPFTAVSLSWDDPAVIADAGARVVDITSGSAAITLRSAADRQTSLGLFAVDQLAAPALDGRTLLAAMPPESALTIQPDGAAVFTAWDLFDPQWRGRQSQWERLELEEGPVTVDYLADDPQPAKTSLTAAPGLLGEALFLLDQEDQISFYWNGDLRYCYDFGRPLQAVSLSDLSGQRQTTFQAAPGFTVRLSAGDENWITVWEAAEEGRLRPEIALPAELEGAEALCVSFGGESDEFYAAEQFYLTARLQAADLAELTRFPAGERTLAYAGQGNGAMLFWDDPAIVAPLPAPVYPADAPAVNQTADALQIAFPTGALLEFPLKNGVPGGLGRLTIGERTIFQAAPGAEWTPPAVVTLLEGDPAPLPPDFDWAAYRDAAVADPDFPFSWQPLWTRTRRPYSLAGSVFQGAAVNGNEVTLTWSVDAPDGAGELAWTFAPAARRIAGVELTGIVSWLRLSGPGLAAAERVTLEFPLLVSPGDWQIEQTFRDLAEDRLTPAAAPRYPQAIWFGQSQSFAFRTGPGRTVLGMFERPAWAAVSLKAENGRHQYRFALPLSAGETRTTAPLLWLAAPAGAADRFTAANVWGRFYEDIRAAYLAQTGVRYTPPLPTVVWNQPLEEQLFPALEQFAASGAYPPEGESWFDWYAQNQLPRAEAAGIQNVIIQAPWVSDGEDPELAASLHAPRDFVVSPLLGGQDGLRRLVEEAHRRGVQVTLWYPSSFSLYSPLPQQYPERITWKIGGAPDDGGWGDILSLNKYEPHRRYVLEKLAALRRDVPFDGLWLDSWVGLAVPTDYAEPQPVPQLDEAVAFLRGFSEMGLTQVAIEGLGPLARSDAYGDYETYTGGPKRVPETIEAAERLRNREYLLYNVGAGLYLDGETLEIYHRLLASGGLMNIANFDEIEALSEDGRAWLRQINRDYAQVREGMQYRQLLTNRDSWLGTAWTQDGTDDLVVFAFAPFTLELDGAATVTDVTTGEQFAADGAFSAEAWHTYWVARP